MLNKDPIKEYVTKLEKGENVSVPEYLLSIENYYFLKQDYFPCWYPISYYKTLRGRNYSIYGLNALLESDGYLFKLEELPKYPDKIKKINPYLNSRDSEIKELGYNLVESLYKTSRVMLCWNQSKVLTTIQNYNFFCNEGKKSYTDVQFYTLIPV